MRRALLLFSLALLAIGAMTPLLEAVAPCAEACVDDSADGQCAGEQCCSCCVHIRLVTADQQVADPLTPTSRTIAAARRPPVLADPHDILHIPKPAIA